MVDDHTVACGDIFRPVSPAIGEILRSVLSARFLVDISLARRFLIWDLLAGSWIEPCTGLKMEVNLVKKCL